MKRLLLAAILLAGVVAGAYAIYAPRSDAEGRAADAPKPAVGVVVTPVIAKAMPVQIGTIGRVQTIASVAVKSRIDGVNSEVLVQYGQTVTAGDLPFNSEERRGGKEWDR